MPSKQIKKFQTVFTRLIRKPNPKLRHVFQIALLLGKLRLSLKYKKCDQESLEILISTLSDDNINDFLESFNNSSGFITMKLLLDGFERMVSIRKILSLTLMLVLKLVKHNNGTKLKVLELGYVRTLVNVCNKLSELNRRKHNFKAPQYASFEGDDANAESSENPIETYWCNCKDFKSLYQLVIDLLLELSTVKLFHFITDLAEEKVNPIGTTVNENIPANIILNFLRSSTEQTRVLSFEFGLQLFSHGEASKNFLERFQEDGKFKSSSKTFCQWMNQLADLIMLYFMNTESPIKHAVRKLSL
jgi:hypothetical protein